MPTPNKAEWLHHCRQERGAWGDALAWAVEEAVATKLDITEDYILDAVGPETIVPALIKAIGEDRRVADALARAHRWAVADRETMRMA